MRILPFGDSVVFGEGFSGGFRAPLEDQLILAKISFEFIGRQHENSYRMKYPNHEGWKRATFSYLRDACLEPAMALNPDIVLVYAGSEDLRDLPDAGIAVARAEKLIKAIYELSPKTSIIYSQLIPSDDYRAENKVKRYNTVLGTVIEKLARKHIPVSRVKTHAAVKSENINEQGFPNEDGYQQMAACWFEAIQELYRRQTELPKRP